MGTTLTRIPDRHAPTLERALFIQPHPDDCVLSVHALLRRSKEPVVLTVFAGVPGPEVRPVSGDALTGSSSPRARMLERRREDHVALSRFGAEVVHLDFVELAHRETKDETHIVAEVSEVLRTIVAAHEVVVAPLGIGGHPNHLQVAAAVRDLADQHGNQVVWYADYPYAAWFSWPHWVREASPDPLLAPEALWVEALERAGHPQHRTVIDLSASAQQDKLESFSHYATQVQVIERGDLCAVSHPEHVRYEVLFTHTPL